MPNFSKNDVVLVRNPFSDLSGSKIRPAVIVNSKHRSMDLFVVPLTSRTTGLLVGEFVLSDWRSVGLNVETSVKRGLYTVKKDLVISTIGQLQASDADRLDQSLRDWLGL